MDPYWSDQATMLWISLDAATASNGALCFLPGTHLQARREASAIDEGFGDEGIGAMYIYYSNLPLLVIDGSILTGCL